MAISICRKSLDRLWPQVLSSDGENFRLPEYYARECIQMVVIMTQMYTLTNEEQQARSLLSSVIRCCRQHILRWDVSSEDTANALSFRLEEAELHLEALQFWKAILGECKGHLSRTQHFTLQVAAAIARLSLAA